MPIHREAAGVANDTICMIFYLNDEAYLNSFKCDKEKGTIVNDVTTHQSSGKNILLLSMTDRAVQ